MSDQVKVENKTEQDVQTPVKDERMNVKTAAKKPVFVTPKVREIDPTGVIYAALN